MSSKSREHIHNVKNERKVTGNTNSSQFNRFVLSLNMDSDLQASSVTLNHLNLIEIHNFNETHVKLKSW